MTGPQGFATALSELCRTYTTYLASSIYIPSTKLLLYGSIWVQICGGTLKGENKPWEASNGHSSKAIPVCVSRAKIERDASRKLKVNEVSCEKSRVPRTTKKPSRERACAAAAPSPDVACSNEGMKQKGKKKKKNPQTNNNNSG